MSQITVSHVLSSPVASVWAKLADFGGVHRFAAEIESSPINPGTPSTGVGAERSCHLYDDNNLQERITEFVEDRRLGVEVFESSMPLKRASALFELTPTSGDCELTLTFDYEVKYGLIGKAMDAIVMRRMMTKNFGALLRALDEHLTTGEDIPRGWQPVRAA